MAENLLDDRYRAERRAGRSIGRHGSLNPTLDKLNWSEDKRSESSRKCTCQPEIWQ
jgi:hypothetical protein